MFAPSPWLQLGLHKQNEPHLALAVLRVCAVPERATTAPGLQAQWRAPGQGNYGSIKNRSFLTPWHLLVQTQDVFSHMQPIIQASKSRTHIHRHTSRDTSYLASNTHSKIHSVNSVMRAGAGSSSVFISTEWIFSWEYCTYWLRWCVRNRIKKRLFYYCSFVIKLWTPLVASAACHCVT